MVTLNYQNLAFSEKNGKVRVLFLKIYYFYLERKDLEKIGKLKVNRHSLNFKTNKKARNNYGPFVLPYLDFTVNILV